MNQSSGDLLNKNPIQPPKKDWAVWLAVGVLFLGATVVTWVVYVAQTPTEVPLSDAQREGIEIGEQMVRLYDLDTKSVGAPEIVETDFVLQDGQGENYPNGVVLISARNVQGVVDRHIKTYALDLENTEAEPLLLMDGLGLTAMAEPRTDTETNELFILASTEGQGEPDGFGVFKFVNDTEVLTQYFGATGVQERNFAWSEDAGLLALNRLKDSEDSYADMLPITSWEIALLDPETDTVTTVIEDAWRPQWFPGGNALVYLKADGLYLMQLENSVELQLVEVPEGGAVTALSMFGVSPDGTKLVWTTAKAGIIRIFDIDTTGQIKVSEVGRIENPEIEYYWPTFSPDSNFYAVQAIDRLKDDDLYRQNARMEVRNLNFKEPILSRPVSQFNFDELFTNAWVEAL